MNHMKVLVIQMPFESDLHNVIQVARAEGMKLTKDPGMRFVISRKTYLE